MTPTKSHQDFEETILHHCGVRVHLQAGVFVRPLSCGGGGRRRRGGSGRRRPRPRRLRFGRRSFAARSADAADAAAARLHGGCASGIGGGASSFFCSSDCRAPPLHRAVMCAFRVSVSVLVSGSFHIEMSVNSRSIQWCAHLYSTTSHSVLKWPKSLCTCNNAYLAQHVAAAAAHHDPGRLSPLAPPGVPARLSACPACPGPLHPCTLPFAWAICPLQLCKNANNKHGCSFDHGNPGILVLSHGTPHGHRISLHNSSPGTGRKFQTRLGNKTAQDALLWPCPAQCATRPSLAVDPPPPSTLPACCPPTAAAWPWPPFSCWVGRAHSLCAANCSSSGGRVEAAALFLTKSGLRFSWPATTSFQFCQGW